MKNKKFNKQWMIARRNLRDQIN